MPRTKPFEPTLLSRATGQVLREVMTESTGSVAAFCEAYGHDRRNIGRVISGHRDAQMGVLYGYVVTNAGQDWPRFMLRVEAKMRELLAREKQPTTRDTVPHSK